MVPFNPYTGIPKHFHSVRPVSMSCFNPKGKDAELVVQTRRQSGAFIRCWNCKGLRFAGMEYEQLLPWFKVDGNTFWLFLVTMSRFQRMVPALCIFRQPMVLMICG